jgi:hypothetical protein
MQYTWLETFHQCSNCCSFWGLCRMCIKSRSPLSMDWKDIMKGQTTVLAYIILLRRRFIKMILIVFLQPSQMKLQSNPILRPLEISGRFFLIPIPLLALLVLPFNKTSNRPCLTLWKNICTISFIHPPVVPMIFLLNRHQVFMNRSHLSLEKDC